MAGLAPAIAFMGEYIAIINRHPCHSGARARPSLHRHGRACPGHPV